MSEKHSNGEESSQKNFIMKWKWFLQEMVWREFRKGAGSLFPPSTHFGTTKALLDPIAT